MLGAIAFLALAYVLVVALLYFAQASLIYPAPRSIGQPTGGFEQVTYETSDGLVLGAGHRAAAPGFPTILYFHGNGADWVSSVVATDRLVPAGYGVLAAEYRGYRGNPGRPSEPGLYRDGRAALRWLGDRGVDPLQVVVIGNSIGAGVATQMAIEHPVRALVLISPFSSLPRVAGEKVPILPASWLVRDRFDNLSKLPALEMPVLILHGDADRVIPVAHSRELARANAGVELEIFPGKGHDLAWDEVAEETVLEFLDRLPAGEAEN